MLLFRGNYFGWDVWYFFDMVHHKFCNYFSSQLFPYMSAIFYVLFFLLVKGLSLLSVFCFGYTSIADNFCVVLVSYYSHAIVLVSLIPLNLFFSKYFVPLGDDQIFSTTKLCKNGYRFIISNRCCLNLLSAPKIPKLLDKTCDM